jgi:hypothetical protein
VIRIRDINQDRSKDVVGKGTTQTSCGDNTSAALETKDAPKGPAAFDLHKLPEQEKPPKGPQKIVDEADKEESFYDGLVEG